MKRSCSPENANLTKQVPSRPAPDSARNLVAPLLSGHCQRDLAFGHRRSSASVRKTKKVSLQSRDQLLGHVLAIARRIGKRHLDDSRLVTSLLLQRQGPDKVNIQVSFGAPAYYPFWNRRPELLIETECVLRKLLRSEGFREVTHRRACSAQRLAELAGSDQNVERLSQRADDRPGLSDFTSHAVGQWRRKR